MPNYATIPNLCIHYDYQAKNTAKLKMKESRYNAATDDMIAVPNTALRFMKYIPA